MANRTKIVCTMGPAVDAPEKIEALILAGMNVARLNFSHGTYEEHAERIRRLQAARSTLRRPLAIMLDTKGPEIRVGKLKKGSFDVKAGQLLKLTGNASPSEDDEIPIVPANVLKDLRPGTTVLFDDGYISTTVEDGSASKVIVRVENGGLLKSGKGVNVPGVDLDLPLLPEKDIADIRFGCQQGVEMLAASFICSAEHVLEIKKILNEEGRGDILIVAKIENHRGIRNFDEILQVADGIMIARGDLGVEVPLAQVPSLQKMMIRKCHEAGKPSIIATQMLESMINNPRPTRAEASDVANAIYDSAAAVMLSGETAVGNYPIETVKMMSSIIQQAESDFNYQHFFSYTLTHQSHDVPSSVTLASLKTAYNAGAKAIFAFTSRGYTARLLSRLRPQMPILALTPSERVYHQLNFNWGVVPIYHPKCDTVDEAYDEVFKFALENQFVRYGDLVVVTAGIHGVAGTTNMMIVKSIGDVLVRGQAGYGPPVQGKVALIYGIDTGHASAEGNVIVISKCDDSYLTLIKKAAGVVLQNHANDLESERYLLLVAKALGLSVIVRADAAYSILVDGQMVTMDPEACVVHNGVVSL